MIASADHDPIRPSDFHVLLARAHRLPWTRELQTLITATRFGDGNAMERLARRVEATP